MRKGRFNVMPSADSNGKVDIWHVDNVQGADINEAVYAVFCVVAQAVLDRSTCFISGDHTAAEIAGSLGGKFVKALVPLTYEHNTMAPETVIRVGGNTYDRHGVLFECRFKTKEVFKQMAEWEGVMNLSSKKYHRFGCECRDSSFCREPLKPYTRCHQPKAANPYSAAANATRINKKFSVIGPMSEALGSEGMKRALSVLTAVKSIGKQHGPQMQSVSKELLMRKLWRDYGKCEPLQRRMAWLKGEMEAMASDGREKDDRYKGLRDELRDIEGRIPLLQRPMPFDARDFQYGPECWKQVDTAYAKELMAYFRQVLDDSKKPEWPANGDMVKMKNQNYAKKWQGKLKALSMYGRLDLYSDRINWSVEVCTTKGKRKSTFLNVDALEPWTEPDKKAVVSKKEKADRKSKDAPAVKHEPTLEEMVCAAIRREMGIAA